MSEEVVVGKRYTLVVPKAIRKEVGGLVEGQRALIYVDGGKIVIEPFPTDPLETLEIIVREPYDEAKDEKRAEGWLKKHASR